MDNGDRISRLYLQEGIVRRMHLGERNREFRFHRTRSLFDLTIVDWKLYYTANEHGFKFYPIISNFRLLFVRDNAFILHSKLNGIYFLVNFEFTFKYFSFSNAPFKAKISRKFSVNCGEI